MRRSGLVLVASLTSVAVLAAGGYRSPDGWFALGTVPAGWQAARQELGQGLYATTVAPGDGGATAVIITYRLDGPRGPEALDTEGRELIGQLLAASGTVRSAKYKRTTFGPREVMRCEVSIDIAGQGPRSGLALAMFVEDQAVIAIATAPSDDAAALAQATSVLESLRLKGEATGGAAPAGGRENIFSRASLASLTDRARNRGGADADEVLVPGNPPLTVGSVQGFVDYVSYMFGIRFTEAEFELTRQRFIEYYQKADADGRQILATGGASLYQQAQRISEAERAEVRQQMAAQFEAGARQGIEWAAVLWEAMQRRGRNVGRTSAKPPRAAQQAAGQQQLDQDFSEADLTATVEMLYFMWVGCGRDPNAATPEVLGQLQAALVQNFAAFPAEFQSVLCNAEKVYAAIRNAWQQADDNTRLAMAQQFAATLDGLGLTQGGGGAGNAGGGGGDAWSDVNPDEITTGLVSNTCWNLAQRSTGGW